MLELSLAFFLKAVYFLITANLVLKTLKWLALYVNKIHSVNKLKGLPMLPFIGNVHQLERKYKFLKQIKEYSIKYKNEPLWRIWLGHMPNYIFHRGDYAEILFSSSKNTQKSVQYNFLHPWLGTGLLTSYGDKWSTRRRLITPTFHFEILDDFLHVMNEQAEILVEILAKLVKEKQTIDIFERLKACALDVICESAMGQNVNAQHDQLSEYVRSVARISELVTNRFYDPSEWIEFIYLRTQKGKEYKKCLKALHDFTKKVILERDADLDDTELMSKKRIAFLDLLLKAKREDPSISFEDIREEVDTFMFEGHDTTAAAASWACQLIGSHPEVQKKLHEEIDSVLGQTNRPLTNEDLKELKYLDLVIKETLRLFPSVPYFGRVISEDCNIGGYKVLKGETAVIAAFMIHRDEKYFPDPEKFDPERFLPENSKDRHPYAYIPFSAGRRNCIGQRFAQMEEKVLLANILRKFELKSIRTIEELEPVGDLILHPNNGIPIELKLRQ
uniref:Cytochrome p450 CYP4V38 n=1 Tax=Brachionus calyciflorus TaxID=104777 RepID=A0A2H4PSI5_9BILA|nr:cytochrome p450 CYP4V38 [Brachionus calyciflorus]